MSDVIDRLTGQATRELGREQRPRYFHTAEVLPGKVISVLVTEDVVPRKESYTRLYVFLDEKMIAGLPL